MELSEKRRSTMKNSGGGFNPDPEKVKYNHGTEVIKLSELLRTALKYMDAEDSDGATEKNGVGFSKDDGKLAREILAKDKWDKEDMIDAFEILKHYKNTQLKDKWKDIALQYNKYTKEIKNEEKNEILEEIERSNWTPIEFENDIPITYAGWNLGQPYKLRIRESKDNVTTLMQKITLRNYENQNIQAKIKRLKIQGNDAVEFQGEVFGKNDFVNMMVFPANCNLFTECINALPIDEEEYREPKLYMENGFLKFPSKYYARRNDSYQKMLKDALKIGNVDDKIYQEAISLMAKRPKQLTLHYAIIGANVINIIGIEDYLNTIDTIGDSDAGKSFVIDTTLQICYGISNAKLQDDAMSSGFRHHNIAGSTNLPIHIEEANMDEKSLKRLKSTGKNVRGNTDKSLTVYNVETTFIFSRNSESKDIKNVDPSEQKAIAKRVHKFIFVKNDVVSDNSEKIIGSRFIQKIKEMPGGILYEKLKSKPIREILGKYHELKSAETKPEYIISKLGAWIMDNPDFVPTVTETKQPTILDEFYGKILDESHRIKEMSEKTVDGADKFKGNYEDSQLRTNLELQENTREFAISVTGFNMIKKSFNFSGSAENFAISYGFQYKNKRFVDAVQKAIVGVIPEDAVEVDAKDTQTTKEQTTKEPEPEETDEETDEETEEERDEARDLRNLADGLID